MLRRFGIYGILGWTLETIFTGTLSLLAGDWSATTRSYLWMHPIYGAGGLLLEQVSVLARPLRLPLRAAMYTSVICAIEYGSGALLRAALGRCPWDYGRSRSSVQGLVRLDYLPAWYLLALMFEHIRDTHVGVFVGASPGATKAAPLATTE